MGLRTSVLRRLLVGGLSQLIARGLSLPGPHAAAAPSREASKEDMARRQKPDCFVSCPVIMPPHLASHYPSEASHPGSSQTHREGITQGHDHHRVGIGGASQRLPATLSQAEGGRVGRCAGFRKLFSHPGGPMTTSEPCAPPGPQLAVDQLSCTISEELFLFPASSNYKG